jgi:hypothetical protein
MKTNKKRVRVSAHAIIRYFQRVLGCNIQEVTEWLVPSHVAQQIKKSGNGIYPVVIHGKCSHRLVVKDGVVLTVESPDMRIRTLK